MKEKLNEFHEATILETANIGKKDGELNIPHQDDTIVSPLEKSLRAKYQSLIENMGVERERELSPCSIDKIKLLRKEKNSIADADIEANLKKLNTREIDILNSETNIHLDNIKETVQDAKLLSAEARMKAADREFKRECKIEGRSSTNKKITSDTSYYIILAFVGLSELAINFKAFEVFRENLILTAMMSLSFIAVPIFAHFCGPMIKQWHDNKHRTSYTVFPLLGISAIIGLLWFIAELRLLQDVPKITLYISFVLGLVISLVGVLVAYFHVDSSDSFYRTYVENNKSKQHYAKLDLLRTHKKKELEKEYKKIRVSIQQDFDQKRSNAKDVVNLKDKEINTLIDTYNSIIAKYKGYEENCNSFYHETIQEYRLNNLSRRITTQPLSWGNDVVDLKYNFIKYENQE